jgi:hypothetical protein
MARLFFFVFAGAFCVATAFFPIRSDSDGSWAYVTFGTGSEGAGFWPDRQIDFPTGAGYYIDVPVWALDMGLFGGAAVAFVLYAKGKLGDQKI